MKRKKQKETKINLFRVLPDEVVCCEIVPFLPIKDVVTVGLTNKFVHQIIDSPLSWSSLIKLYYPKEVVDDINRMFKESSNDNDNEMKNIFQKLYECHRNSSNNYQKLYKWFIDTKEIQSYFPNISMDKLTSLNEGDFQSLIQKYQSLRQKKVTTEQGIFEGVVVDGVLKHGTYEYNNGSRYVGEMKDGKRHGHGHLKYEGGDEYKGMFRNGVRHGKGGYYCCSSRKKVSGNFVNGKLQGEGTCFYPNGSVCYKGNYVNGSKEGYGVLYYPGMKGREGDIQFEGKFKKGKKNGFGRYYFKNGNVLYEGEWMDNYRHGTGTMYNHDSAKIVCNFIKNVVTGKGESYNSSGDMDYKGDFRNGKRHGEGVFFFRDGSEYKGEFKDGASEGKGILKSVSHGLIFDGKWTRVRTANNFDFEGKVVDVITRQEYFGKWVCGVNRHYDEEKLIFHFGKMCRQCLVTPIVGRTRYQCTIYPKKCNMVMCKPCYHKGGCNCHKHQMNKIVISHRHSLIN